ncbi:ABC transporter [Actinophytocola xinjiangensis]|uniref:ABC transporter n=1 Tax=Actinophytocola xinjiangensis TaxID=485602 RepID=A0A7Z1AVH7_9PSEU|nr:ABC transporter ATP-binding protein [Actinophytocola xinjiangensis]OLF05324.1 ABC transporter [Actinophytocola xinjiangensis]
MSGATIELRGVRKTFRAGDTEITAVDDVSLSIPAGAVVALTGPSGSGKSTLLHLVGAIDTPDAGEVEVDGRAVHQLRRKDLIAYRRTVGFVFQRYHLLPALTAADNVVAPLLPYRTSFDKTERARELLAAVGLEHRADALPARMSGGEQQRVAIARALVARPTLLLADEPTGNLDSRTGADVLDLLLGLRDEHDMTIVIATHERQVAASCDRMLRLRDGGVIDDLDLTAGHSPESTLARINSLGA